MKDRSHDDAMAELFRNDPSFATQYVSDILDTDNRPALLVALRQIALAFDTVEDIVDRANPVGQRLERLRAAIAAGKASGPGIPASVVFDRLAAKYRDLSPK